MAYPQLRQNVRSYKTDASRLICFCLSNELISFYMMEPLFITIYIFIHKACVNVTLFSDFVCVLQQPIASVL